MLEKELEEKKSDEDSKEETNIIFNEKYFVDDEEISLILGETGKEISLTMYGHAKDREKAFLMFATLLAECENIEKLLGRYSVVVNFGKLNITYMTTDSGYMVMGTNEDGNTTLKMPDWIPQELSELTMGEDEIENYILELDSKIMDFGKTSGYRMGVFVNENQESTMEDDSEIEEIESTGNAIVYEDGKIIVTYNGIGGKENNYKIKLIIENLTDKTLTVQVRETSINGFMVDPTCSIEIAPGKKAVDGMTIWGDDAELIPMSKVENIETKFHVFNKDDWSDRYDTENVIVYNAE